MDLRKFYTGKTIGFIIVLAVVFLTAGIYQIHTLQIAHSSFTNYYNFRGCFQLVEKTDEYGICRTSSGETIKLVRVKDKWFLDGDINGI
ncbi:MAG: hypothetical protein WCW87_02895 [Candidatus Paceibacterota bacterium]